MMNGDDEPLMARAVGMQSAEAMGVRFEESGGAARCRARGGGTHPGGTSYSPEKYRGCVLNPAAPDALSGCLGGESVLTGCMGVESAATVLGERARRARGCAVVGAEKD